MVQAPENIQSLNRYSYVMNNPLNATDPSGYIWVTLVVMALKAIAASAAVSSAVATAIGYVLTAYKFYGYYQMARGVFAASKGNSAMIGKFVGGMVKNYAKSMAISYVAGLFSADDKKAETSKKQGSSEADTNKEPKSKELRIDVEDDSSLNGSVEDKSPSNILIKYWDKASQGLAIGHLWDMIGDQFYNQSQVWANLGSALMDTSLGKVFNTISGMRAPNLLKHIVYGNMLTNEALGFIGTVAGYCGAPACQAVSGVTAGLQFAIHGDIAGYQGVAYGEFINQGFQRKFPRIHKIFSNLGNGAVADEMSNGRYSGTEK